jgi:hypothetical protein
LSLLFLLKEVFGNVSLYEYQRDIYERYIRALVPLRRCLEDQEKKMELETVCASILLQICEVRPALFQSDENSS